MSDTPLHQDTRLLQLRPDGMFSNVNEVVEQLRLAALGGYRFAIDWSASCYRDPDRTGDPWAYYFAPCFPDAPPPSTGATVLPSGPDVACARHNIITPRLEDGKCNPLLLPLDRHGAHTLIAAHLALRPEVAVGIDSFAARLFRPRMIGLHIRGPGRTDGGVRELRRKFGEGNVVPLDAFFRQTDEALRLLSDAGILACSDSAPVLEAVRHRYGDRVVSWPSLRSEFGEMHARHPANAGLSFPPYRLGLDILSEAYLLARTDLFVHGNSNVANFVLCAAPDLIHAYVPA